MLNVIPATAEMLERFLGQKPPNSARVIAFELGGAVLGVAGLYLDECRYVLFGNFGDEVRAAPRAIVKAYRALIAQVRGNGLPIHAAAEETVPAARRFLEHMGFRRQAGGHFELET